MPPTVRYTAPAIPDVAKNAKETSPILEAYEQANEKNRRAIETARAHNRKLQGVYNKPASKAETSSWVSPKWPEWPSWGKFDVPGLIK